MSQISVDKKKREQKCSFQNVLESQSYLNFVDCRDSIDAVSVRYDGVRLVGIVAEQQLLLAIEGVFRPGDIRQRADGAGSARVVGVMMIDEVNWCCPRQWSESRRGKERKKMCIPKASVPKWSPVKP